jgi:hypothetical protein
VPVYLVGQCADLDYEDGGCWGQDLDGGRFNVEKEAKGGAGELLAVGTVAGVAEEGGGEETVTDGVTNAAAYYGGEGLVFGWCGGLWF